MEKSKVLALWLHPSRGCASGQQAKTATAAVKTPPKALM